MIFTPTQSTLSTLLLVVCHSSKGDDVGVPERSAGDYLHLSCRINSTLDDTEEEEQQEDQPGHGVRATLLGGQMKVMNRVMSSPNYPRNYPNRSECLEVITAPRGHRIRLDFGDDFHLESSNDCDFDYVELRDGPFGYSPLLGRYCGSQRPPVTESTGRYLWVRFQSDEYIEYTGFQAFYGFFELDGEERNRTASGYAQVLDVGISDDEVCRIKVDTSRHEGIISHLDIAPAFLDRTNQSAAPIDCTWLVYSPPTNRIYLRWMKYQMPPTPHACQDSYLSVYERTTAESDKRREFCGAIARDLQLTSNRVYLRMFSKTRSLMPAFRIIFTVYKNGPCPSWLFHCGDNTCINKSLVCNEQVNCNYSLDEVICRPTTETSPSPSVPLSTSVQTLAVAMVTGAIVTIVVIVCLVACRQRHMERRLRRHALKQEARHAEGADLLGLHGGTTFDWPPPTTTTHTKTCFPQAADEAPTAVPPKGSELQHAGGPLLQSRVASDHYDPLLTTQGSDSKFHVPSIFEMEGSHVVPSNSESGGKSNFHGVTPEGRRGPDFPRPLTEPRSSNFQGTQLESSVYEKIPERTWTAAQDGAGKPWKGTSSRDVFPRFQSEFSPFLADEDDVERSNPHRDPISSDPKNPDEVVGEGAEVGWGYTGSRTLPLSRCYDGLQNPSSSSSSSSSSNALPRTTSGPDVIVGNRSRGTRKSSQTGNDRDAILEPITVAGETTFPVHPEVTSSAARLREPGPAGAGACSERCSRECGASSSSTFLSDASGESVSRVGHVVSKRCHGDALEASCGADLMMATPSGDWRLNETERQERVLCRGKDDRTWKSGK